MRISNSSLGTEDKILISGFAKLDTHGYSGWEALSGLGICFDGCSNTGACQDALNVQMELRRTIASYLLWVSSH